MNFKATGKIAAAAFMLAATSSPALAERESRSGFALPAKSTSIFQRSTDSRSTSFIGSRSSNGGLSGAGTASSASRTTQFFGGSDRTGSFFGGNGGSGGGFGGGGFLGRLLFAILPPSARENLIDIIEQGGPASETLCRIFNFRQCDDPDSPG